MERARLLRELHTKLSHGFIHGDSVDRMSAELAGRMGVSYSRARRLIQTETTFFTEQAGLGRIERGVAHLPFHPCCRCTTAPYVDREIDVRERAAKDANGEGYEVPEDLSYNNREKRNCTRREHGGGGLAKYFHWLL